MGLYRASEPTEEPITAAEAKVVARITTSDLDSVVAWAITEARAQFEQLTQRVIAERDMKLFLDAFPAVDINLEVAPPVTVSQLRYRDADGNWAVVDSANYTVSTAYGDTPVDAWLLPAYGYDWPDTYPSAECVEISMTVGYARADVPADIKGWVARQTALLVDQRTDVDLSNDLTVQRWQRRRLG